MMAHPERYRYVKEYEVFYGRLRKMGVAFQVNINSLGGYYGRDARNKALWLAERGWIDFLGSDIHGEKQVLSLKKTLESGILERVCRRNGISNDLV
jgi:tyrosine-protein phosphatase YwqE